MALFHPDIVRQQIRAMLFYYGALPLLVLGPGFLLDRLLALPRLPGGMAVMALALCLSLGGVGLIAWSTLDLERRGNGTPSPFRPARRLVTCGSYRLCRHSPHPVAHRPAGHLPRVPAVVDCRAPPGRTHPGQSFWRRLRALSPSGPLSAAVSAATRQPIAHRGHGPLLPPPCHACA